MRRFHRIVLEDLRVAEEHLLTPTGTSSRTGPGSGMEWNKEEQDNVLTHTSLHQQMEEESHKRANPIFCPINICLTRFH